MIPIPEHSTRTSGGTRTFTPPIIPSTRTSVTPGPRCASRKSSPLPPITPTTQLWRAGTHAPALLPPPMMPTTTECPGILSGGSVGLGVSPSDGWEWGTVAVRGGGSPLTGRVEVGRSARIPRSCSKVSARWTSSLAARTLPHPSRPGRRIHRERRSSSVAPPAQAVQPAAGSRSRQSRSRISPHPVHFGRDGAGSGLPRPSDRLEGRRSPETDTLNISPESTTRLA